MDGIRLRRIALKEVKADNQQGDEGMAASKTVLTEDHREVQPLSPASRLFTQPRLNCYIVAIMGFGKRLDVDVVKKGLEDTLLRHPRFTSIQAKTTVLLSFIFYFLFLSFFPYTWSGPMSNGFNQNLRLLYKLCEQRKHRPTF